MFLHLSTSHCVRSNRNFYSLGDPTLLVGSQRIVFKTLFELSQKYASLDTPPLTLESLANLSQLRSSQIHTATKELRKKQCISIGNRKDGRGGWVSYRLSKVAFDSWQKLNIEQYRRENVEITQRKRSEEHGDKHGDGPPCSSSNINNISTTTEDGLWDNLNFDELSEFRISRALLNRVLNKNPELDFEAVSKFLNRLPQRLKDPKKQRINNPIGFFIDCLNQIARGEEPLADIISDDEKLLGRVDVS